VVSVGRFYLPGAKRERVEVQSEIEKISECRFPLACHIYDVCGEHIQVTTLAGVRPIVKAWIRASFRGQKE
jgi:hypothetical protein